MRWIDAHCHLEKGEAVRAAELLERARQAGVVHVIVVGQLQESGDFGDALSVASSQPGFLTPTMGIHPHDAAVATEADFAELRRLCALPEVRAVGEAGLDYHYDRSPREVQVAVFERQCALAVELGKPLVVHVRDAHDECARILARTGSREGMIHCFTGDTDDARRYLDLGFGISISGIVTYAKNTQALQDAVRFVPLDRLTVETDSPYLAPVPHRGKRNEPSWVVETGRRVAELKGESLEKVAAVTTANAARLFGLTL